MLLKIKLARVASGLSQKEVGKALGIAQRTWSHYEKGNSALPADMLLQLPAILGVKISDLLPDSVVTAVDQRRSRDLRLEKIIILWPDISEQGKDNLLNTALLIARGTL